MWFLTAMIKKPKEFMDCDSGRVDQGQKPFFFGREARHAQMAKRSPSGRIKGRGGGHP
ncbi:hypothetical protein CCP2SC5_400005 [Azospirillaceae bacterium]